MATLKTSQVKPNPTGKDKDKWATAAQLGAEWVDVKNPGDGPVSLEGVKVQHVAFVNGKASHWELVMSLKGALGAGKVLRIHSGSGPESALRAEDLAGADYHLFRGSDVYIWNNAEGDTSRITVSSNGSGQDVDKASYDPHPPEGVKLVRSADKLVPGGVGAYAAAFGLR